MNRIASLSIAVLAVIGSSVPAVSATLRNAEFYAYVEATGGALGSVSCEDAFLASPVGRTAACSDTATGSQYLATASLTARADPGNVGIAGTVSLAALPSVTGTSFQEGQMGAYIWDQLLFGTLVSGTLRMGFDIAGTFDGQVQLSGGPTGEAGTVSTTLSAVFYDNLAGTAETSIPANVTSRPDSGPIPT